MALIEKTLLGEKNKVEEAIGRLKAFEPPYGYFLAFSGGKDSQCIYHLAEMSGVKFDAHYSVTSVDPPELVRFMMKNYPDVIFDYHRYWLLLL
jgi:phosphoadenosine phosphosulfate reductase